MARAKPESYSSLQRALHWLIALLVIALLIVGLYMTWRGGSSKLLVPILGKSERFDDVTGTLYLYHKSIGFLVLWLVLLRVVVRLTRGVPAPEPSLNAFQRLASEATHLGIYALLVAVPALGWYGVSAYGARGVVGGFSLPELVAKDERLANTILAFHGWAAIALGALVAMHIGAALMHRFVLKDGVFKRMWP